jgi:hypothetical protein
VLFRSVIGGLGYALYFIPYEKLVVTCLNFSQQHASLWLPRCNVRHTKREQFSYGMKLVVSCCGVAQAQGVSYQRARRCGTLKDVAVGRLAREQLSKRRTMSALEILGEKKPRRSGVEISYGMKFMLRFQNLQPASNQ